jgi:hypothetical protein
MDTWYYDELEDLGRIRLGDGPITVAAGVVRSLAAHLAGFREAFAGLFRLDQSDRYMGIPIASEHLAEQLASRLPESHVIRGMIAHFDIWAAVRAEGGAIQHQWIPGVGNLWLSTQEQLQPPPSSVSPPVPAPAQSQPWSAHVMLGVGSLFRPDNQQTLINARVLWKRLRQQNPQATCFTDLSEDETVTESLVFTLADPPPGTPADNRELAALNLPRLQTAIIRWEQITGQPFKWAEPFKRLG